MRTMNALPDRLRQALERDARPVRPLSPAWLRLGWVLLWGLSVATVVPALFGMRRDAGALGFFLVWGVGVAQLGLGLWLVYLALRESVPAAGFSRGVRLASLLVAGAVPAAAGIIIWARLEMPLPGPMGLAKGLTCMTMETALGLPALLLTVLLVGRAWAVRPRWAGLLGGAGAGLLADAVQHLICPVADLQHVLIWHGAAIILLSLAGWVAGLMIERRRSRCQAHRS